MDLEKKFGQKPLHPSDARSILQALPMDTPQGAQDFTLLVSMAATGMRAAEALDLRMRQRKQLPVIVWELTGAYWEMMESRFVTLENDYAFPNLLWRDMGQCVARTPRHFVLMVKAAAEAAGLDSGTIGVATWRVTAAVIARRPGGFAAFARGLQALNELPVASSAAWQGI